MRSKIVRVVRNRVTLLLFGLLMLAAAPAIFVQQASAAWACASGYVCFYSDANYSGDALNYSNPAPGCYNVGPQFNDRISSLHNYLSRSITIYMDNDCSFWSAKQTLAAGTNVDNFSTYFLFWNDEMSSFRVN